MWKIPASAGMLAVGTLYSQHQVDGKGSIIPLPFPIQKTFCERLLDCPKKFDHVMVKSDEEDHVDKVISNGYIIDPTVCLQVLLKISNLSKFGFVCLKGDPKKLE